MTAASPNREITLEDALAQLTESDRSELQVLLGQKLEQLRDDGIATAFSNWTTPTILAGALTAILFPLGGVGGLMGVFGMFGLSIGLPMIGVWQAFQTSGKILEGDTSLLVETLGKEKILAAQKDAIETKLEYAKKRLPPDTQVKGANPATTNQSQNPQTSKFGTTVSATSSPQPESAAQRQASGSPQGGSGNGTSESKSGVKLSALDDLLNTAIASSVLLASLRGTGKTSLLQELFSRSQAGDIIGLDPKNSNSLGILEPFFHYVPPDDALTYLAVILRVREELDRRNSKRLKTEDCKPLWLVIDEYQTTRQCWKKEQQEKAKSALSFIINQGRERRVFVVLMGQSPLCVDIGFSGGERANMAILALGCDEQRLEQGGGGGWYSVDQILASAHLIPDKSTRESFKLKLDLAKQTSGRRGRVLVTPSGVALVPDLSKKTYPPLGHSKWGEMSSSTEAHGEVKEADSESDTTAVYLSASTTEEDVIKEVKRRIEGFLQGKPPKKVHEITSGIKRKQDEVNPSSENVKSALSILVEHGVVAAEKDENTSLYSLTGTTST